MSEVNRSSGFLERFSMGEAMAEHDGVCCYPAMENGSQDKYIVKKIAVPSNSNQLTALLLSGAYASREDALCYYKDLAEEILRDAEVLGKLSQLEGFVPYLHQDVHCAEDQGYTVTLLAPYRTSLQQLLEEQPMTHQGIMDLALDLCTAMAACRSAGYLYVDLKPENVFYTEQMEYRVGDLGFVALSSLRFASLPDKYRSVFTPPEIEDAMSQLNTTMDVYALGLVLYQAYNGGGLPLEDGQLTLPLLPPAYADYEMAEIILKACHPEPQQRWQTPGDLSQALLAYMQRNGVSDECIVPAPVQTPELDVGEEFLPEEDPSAEEWIDIPELAALDDQEEELEDPAMTEADRLEQTAQMLAQAEELIAHTLPDPVIPPEPVEIPIPEPIVLEPEETEEPVFLVEPLAAPEEPEAEAVPVDEPEEKPEEAPEEKPEEAMPVAPEPVQTSEAPPQKQEEKPAVAVQKEEKEAGTNPRREMLRRLAFSALAVALVICLAIIGFRYYQDNYVKIIQELTVTGTADTIIVHVRTDVEESQLRITCSDTYGNTLSSKVSNGTAVFSGLSPQTRYTIRVTTLASYKLDGYLTDTFTTESQTVVEAFTAEIGPADGSVYLSFRVSGVECERWVLTWSAPGIGEQSDEFTGHGFTVYDLVVGKNYTFVLSAADGGNVIGQTEVTFRSARIARAENARITACGNGMLTVTWQAPNGEPVESWKVRCRDSSGYDQTITTASLSATFVGLSHETACSVEIVAQGMTQGTVVSICADPINITQFTCEPDGSGKLLISWQYSGGTPEGGWSVSWSCDGLQPQFTETQANQALLPLIPGGQYTVILIPADDTDIFGQTCSVTAPEVEAFTGFGLTAEALTVSMCVIPDQAQWYWADIAEEDRRSEFTAGELCGLALETELQPEMTGEAVQLTFLIRDGNGTLCSLNVQDMDWSLLWRDGVWQLTLPELPEISGDYSLTVLLDGMLLTQQVFTVQ